MLFKPRGLGFKGKGDSTTAPLQTSPLTEQPAFRHKIPNIPLPPQEAENFVRAVYLNPDDPGQQVWALKKMKKKYYREERDRIFLRYALLDVERALIKIKDEFAKTELKKREFGQLRKETKKHLEKSSLDLSEGIGKVVWNIVKTTIKVSIFTAGSFLSIKAIEPSFKVLKESFEKYNLSITLAIFAETVAMYIGTGIVWKWFQLRRNDSDYLRKEEEVESKFEAFREAEIQKMKEGIADKVGKFYGESGLPAKAMVQPGQECMKEQGQ